MKEGRKMQFFSNIGHALQGSRPLCVTNNFNVTFLCYTHNNSVCQTYTFSFGCLQ